jgi:hypothetical protein
MKDEILAMAWHSHKNVWYQTMLRYGNDSVSMFHKVMFRVRDCDSSASRNSVRSAICFTDTTV